MEIFWAVVVLILSFLLLVWGGDKFVDASIGVSKKLKIPSVVVGATITSIGTTLPELLVTVFSGASDSASLALGNAMGSIIFNSCLIGGILLICLTLKGSNSKTPSLLLIFSATFLCVTAINKKLDLWECIILLILFVTFFV
ncbi:MAG: sodium:calcium antiporter, partial [Clostridia bacterium]|nr:sodium:calcium antiporter [Clostridia bacterium]